MRLRRGMGYGELQVRIGHLICILWHPVVSFVVRRRVCVQSGRSCLRWSDSAEASRRCKSSVAIVYGARFPCIAARVLMQCLTAPPLRKVTQGRPLPSGLVHSSERNY